MTRAPLGGQAVFSKAQNTPAHVLRKKFGVENVEAKLYGGGGLIDMLAAGAGERMKLKINSRSSIFMGVYRGIAAEDGVAWKNGGAFAMEMRRGISSGKSGRIKSPRERRVLRLSSPSFPCVFP